LENLTGKKCSTLVLIDLNTGFTALWKRYPNDSEAFGEWFLTEINHLIKYCTIKFCEPDLRVIPTVLPIEDINELRIKELFCHSFA